LSPGAIEHPAQPSERAADNKRDKGVFANIVPEQLGTPVFDGRMK